MQVCSDDTLKCQTLVNMNAVEYHLGMGMMIMEILYACINQCNIEKNQGRHAKKHVKWSIISTPNDERTKQI